MKFHLADCKFVICKKMDLGHAIQKWDSNTFLSKLKASPIDFVTQISHRGSPFTNNGLWKIEAWGPIFRLLRYYDKNRKWQLLFVIREKPINQYLPFVRRFRGIQAGDACMTHVIHSSLLYALLGQVKKKEDVSRPDFCKKRGGRASGFFYYYLLFPIACFLYTLLPSPRDTLELIGQILIKRNIRYWLNTCLFNFDTHKGF